MYFVAKFCFSFYNCSVIIFVSDSKFFSLASNSK